MICWLMHTGKDVNTKHIHKEISSLHVLRTEHEFQHFSLYKVHHSYRQTFYSTWKKRSINSPSNIESYAYTHIIVTVIKPWTCRFKILFFSVWVTPTGLGREFSLCATRTFRIPLLVGTWTVHLNFIWKINKLWKLRCRIFVFIPTCVLMQDAHYLSGGGKVKNVAYFLTRALFAIEQFQHLIILWTQCVLVTDPKR